VDDFLNEEEQSSIYESFSDIALCTLTVALLLVTLLAIRITHNVNVEVNRSKFSGGVMRPSIHLECTLPEFEATTAARYTLERMLFSGKPYVAVHLFSPSLAMIATDVREGGTVALGEDQTFLQQQDLPLYQFLELAAGIEPGSFLAEGQLSALLIPSILNKQMVYEPAAERGYRTHADRPLTKLLLSTVWPIYENPLYVARRPEEFSDARTKVYVETQAVPRSDGGENHYVIIGHLAYKLPEALDNGSLAWLGGFSSGLTEIVFLGESWTDKKLESNKRIDFFDQHGFEDAAEAYRDYAFPLTENGANQTVYDKLLEAGVNPVVIRRRMHSAEMQIAVSKALLGGQLAELKENCLAPPLLAYPDAWHAYITYFEKKQPDPPKWFYGEFLDRLGFDRLTIESTIR